MRIGTPTQPTAETKRAILAELARLQSAVVASNLENAIQYFNLGKAIEEGAGRLAMHQTHLMNDASINHNRGRKAVRWFRSLRDDAGGFDRDRYEQAAHLVREQVEAGEAVARFDPAGYPTVSAMQRQVGGRSRPPSGTPVPPFEADAAATDRAEAPAERYTGTTPTSNTDGLSRMLEDMGDHALANRLRNQPAGAQDARRPGKDARPPLVVGEQPLLPFDLTRAERALADRVDELVARLADGRIDELEARRVFDTIEAATELASTAINKANS